MAGFLDEGKMIESVNSGLTYIGYAWPGTLTTDAKWKIKRVTVVGTLTTVEYALPPRGYNSVTDYYIFKWNDRASLTSWG
jgi:hypothetical protein